MAANVVGVQPTHGVGWANLLLYLFSLFVTLFARHKVSR